MEVEVSGRLFFIGQLRQAVFVGGHQEEVLQAEQVLEGGPLTENSIATAAAAAASEAHPIDDFRAGGDYRRQMVEVLVKRGLSEML